MSGVRISLFIYENNSKNNHCSFTIPVDDIGKTFTSFGYSYMTSEDYLASNADIDSDLLTRILVDDLSVNIHLPNRKKISLSGKNARLDVDFENIVLEGPANITASDGEELTASEAVWSKRFNGIYLPKGYKLQGNYLKNQAFFILDKESRFSKVSRVPRINYKDLIEDKEEAFYASLSKKMPTYAKFLLGIP